MYLCILKGENMNKSKSNVNTVKKKKKCTMNLKLGKSL